MSFDVDFDDIEDPDAIGGKDRVMEGEYHMLIESLEEDGGKNGAMHVDFQVLRGTTPGQETKIYPMDFSKDYGKANRAKIVAFAVAARLKTEAGQLVTPKLIAELKAKRESARIVWEDAVGRSVCMKLIRSEDGKWVNLDWDRIWSPDDKRAAHIPLNAATIQREGIRLPANRPVDGILAKQAAANDQKKSGGSSASSKKPVAAEVSVDDALDGVI